jgi:hypothetical protein
VTKRFSETDKWRDKWFRELCNDHRILWYYLLENCDNAGIFEADWGLISFYINREISEEEALKVLEGKITKVSRDIFIINKFIEFQYGELKVSCAPHLKVLRCLKKVGLCSYKIEIVRRGNQDRSFFKDINADAYSTLLGRVLSIVPGRVHSTPMEEEEDKEEKEEEEKEEKEKEKRVLEIIEYWNEKKIWVHEIDQDLVAEIQKKMKKKKLTNEVLKAGIDNYATVFHDPQSFFKWKWPLAVFLGRKNAHVFFMEGFDRSTYTNKKTGKVVNLLTPDDLPD